MRHVRRVACSILVVLAGVLVSAAPAGAQEQIAPGSGTYLTVAARSCPTYESIRANKARNNIQESLRDLGADTPYRPGEPVDADIEAATQPDCAPITGWRFTLGTGIAPRKVVGPWGSLSVVDESYAGDIVTEASVPERDDQGRPLPTSIAGATTIELTIGQLKQAARNDLWIQGGTVDDPVLARDPAFADGYGFGALRCSIDNVNGDNVEYLGIPSGARHAVCFAYYVTPPPTSGTIVVRKQVSDPPGATEIFDFQGNISYTADERFSLEVVDGAPAAATFYRAATRPGDAPWTIRELVPEGWDLTGLSCTSAGSTVTTDPASATVSIALVAGDTVTCTFTDALRPPPGRLLLRKRTLDGIGEFPFLVRGENALVRAVATTTEEDVPADAEPSPIELEDGTYRVRERLPRSRAGRWELSSADCNAVRRSGPEPVEVTITAGRGAVCTFTNRFVPLGALTIRKTTRGGTGTTGFVVSPLDDPSVQHRLTVTTTEADRGAAARLRRLPLGSYVIQETGTASDDEGDWTLTSVDCGAGPVPFEQGRVVVRLTEERPRRECRFENELSSAEPPAPLPPDVVASGTDEPDLVIRKRALRRAVAVNGIVAFAITVTNAGTAAAEGTIVADGVTDDGQIASAEADRGECEARLRLAVCRVGTVLPGETVTLRVRARATRSPVLVNVAAAGSVTAESPLANNAAAAVVRVRDAGGILGTCARSGPVARAAC